jgi:hypothetical protein
MRHECDREILVSLLQIRQTKILQCTFYILILIKRIQRIGKEFLQAGSSVSCLPES